MLYNGRQRSEEEGGKRRSVLACDGKAGQASRVSFPRCCVDTTSRIRFRDFTPVFAFQRDDYA